MHGVFLILAFDLQFCTKENDSCTLIEEVNWNEFLIFVNAKYLS